MVQLASVLVGSGVGLLLYTYALYPALLKILGLARARPAVLADPDVWPTVSISLPAYNEEYQIAETLESLLSLEYARDRLQILVVSDASTDSTDEIVRAYADRGVELLRVPERKGKGAAEIAATPHLSGEIVVNTDASVRIAPDSLKPLIRQFSDSEVGLASGRDISVSSGAKDANKGESKYVGYEMAVRDLETRVGSIVGASGSFYAIRHHLHRMPLPISLSRDFAAALHCRERAYRAVSVSEAVCYVPRVTSPRLEYPRKVRTITRGLQTLLHKRHLLNPFRHGLFSWMLVSHKVCRWLVPWGGAAALVGLAVLAFSTPWALAAFAVSVAGLSLALVGWLAPEDRHLPRLLQLPAFVLMGNLAAMHAAVRAVRGDSDARWDPTRRAFRPGD